MGSGHGDFSLIVSERFEIVEFEVGVAAFECLTVVSLLVADFHSIKQRSVNVFAFWFLPGKERAVF